MWDIFVVGLWRKILFTLLELMIAGQTQGQSQVGASITLQVGLMWIPLACAIAGVFAGRCRLVRPATHPLAVVLLPLLIGAPGLFNLFVLFLTAMTGYC